MDNKKKLSDEQILKMISEFEALKEEEKAARLLGKGVDKIVYDVPGQDMVLKVPNTTGAYTNNSLQSDYIYSKQLNRHAPVETPILVKRPESTDVLLQRKLKTLTDPDFPSKEFYKSVYDSNKDRDARDAAIDAETKRIKDLPDNKAETTYLKKLDSQGIEEGDFHRGNIALDKDGTPKAIDVSKFWVGEHAPAGVDLEAKNNALHKMREAFSDNMDKITKTRIFRSVAGALPLAGTAMALSSGDANAAMEELPGEIPFVGQAYEAIKPDTAGSSMDDREMINEVEARKNYDNSPAAKDRRRTALTNLKDLY